MTSISEELPGPLEIGTVAEVKVLDRDELDEGTILGLPVFEGLELLGEASLDDQTKKWCENRRFKGAKGQVLPLAPDAHGQPRVLIGMGKKDALATESFRRAGASLARSREASSCVAMDLSGASSLLGVEQSSSQDGWSLRQVAPSSGLAPSLSGLAQAVTEGALIAGYRNNAYRSRVSEGAEASELALVALIGSQEEKQVLEAGAERAWVIAQSVVMARDLQDAPARVLTPTRLASTVEALCQEEPSLQVEVWDEARCRTEGLGGLLAVAAGSHQPPCLVRLSYRPRSASSRVALVGKGITFDSGGLSLKSAEGMVTMKTDMSGAAVVFAAMLALARLGAAVEVDGFLAVTENMPGGGATKPGDVLKARNGKTIEVLNTDAEGRLVLADALALAAESAPDAIVDLATLTGACVTALGPDIAGVLGNNPDLMGSVIEAGARSGEPVWPLPMPDSYRKHIDSDLADMKNVGLPGGRGGAIAGAMLLKEFVGGVPWAHLDIAGPARSSVEDGLWHKGGTGFGVRLLVELLSPTSSVPPLGQSSPAAEQPATEQPASE